MKLTQLGQVQHCFISTKDAEFINEWLSLMPLTYKEFNKGSGMESGQGNVKWNNICEKVITIFEANAKIG